MGGTTSCGLWSQNLSQHKYVEGGLCILLLANDKEEIDEGEICFAEASLPIDRQHYTVSVNLFVTLWYIF